MLSEVDTEAENAPGVHPGLGKPGLRPGLSSGAWIELVDVSMDARGFQELRELGSSDGRGMLALNIKTVKY